MKDAQISLERATTVRRDWLAKMKLVTPRIHEARQWLSWILRRHDDDGYHGCPHCSMNAMISRLSLRFCARESHRPVLRVGGRAQHCFVKAPPSDERFRPCDDNEIWVVWVSLAARSCRKNSSISASACFSPRYEGVVFGYSLSSKQTPLMFRCSVCGPISARC
jgi:hypothetical protein